MGQKQENKRRRGGNKKGILSPVLGQPSSPQDNGEMIRQDFKKTIFLLFTAASLEKVRKKGRSNLFEMNVEEHWLNPSLLCKPLLALREI